MSDLLKKFTSRSQARDQETMCCGRDFLDEFFPLAGSSHHNVAQYQVYYQHLCVVTDAGKCLGLKHSAQFDGFYGSRENPDTILLKDRGVHVEIQIDPMSKPGSTELPDMRRIYDV